MTTRSTRRVWLLAPALLAASGLALVGLGLGSSGEAVAEGPLVAGSVCEAQDLKRRKEIDPSLEIEIPAQFASPWPSWEACRAHEAAEDPDTPGAVQPIQFSHKHHAGLYQIECLYCHAGTDRSAAAGVPSVELCMGCHSQFPSSYEELEGIRTLKSHWGIETVQNDDGTWKSLERVPEQSSPIEWQQIHRLPEHAQFRHNRHIQAGFDCSQCHGEVAEMDKIYLVEDTHFWPWLLPARTLEMGWCINCHRQNNASQDCYVCHY